MNNEVMARAITGIDDELVACAYDNTVPFRKKKKITTMLLAAACLALTFSVAFFAQRLNTPEISAYGIVLSEEPITVSSPSVSEPGARSSDSNLISVPIEIKRSGTVRLASDDGVFDVCSAEDGKFLYSGNSFKATCPVTVRWTVANPNTEKEYKLKINGNSEIIRLSYDKKKSNWIITK